MLPRPPVARLPFFAVVGAGFLVVQDVLARTPLQSLVTGGLASMAIIATLNAVVRNRRVSPSCRSEPTNPRRSMGSGALWIFVLFAGAMLLVTPSFQGVQNWLVWLLFPAVVMAVSASTTAGTFERFMPYWRKAAIFAALAYLAIATVYGLGYADAIYSARGAGWILIIGLAPFIACAAVLGTSKLPAYLIIVASATTLTRASTTIGGLMFLALAARGKGFARTLRLTALAAAVATAAYLAVTKVPAIQERFTVGDGQAVGGVAYNSSGRAALWEVTYKGALESPWFGHGPGQSQYLIERVFVVIAHPHNEYLRIFYDTGLFGLMLWFVGTASLVRAAWQRYKAATRPMDAATHLSAALAGGAYLMGCIPDNLTVTIAFVIPTAALIGLSCGRANAEDAQSNDRLQASMDLACTSGDELESAMLASARHSGVPPANARIR